MLVMQATDGLSAGKLAYAGVALASAAISLIRLVRISKSAWLAPFRNALLFSLLLAILIAVYTTGSILSGVEPTRVLRDALTYFLIAMAPLVGLDAASSRVSQRSAYTAVVVIVMIGAVAFAVYWLAQRGVSTLGLDRLVLPSMMLVGVGVAVGVVRGLTPQIRPMWLLLAVFALGCILITGTRTGLVFLLAPLAALGALSKLRVSLLRLVGCVAGMALLMLAILPLASGMVATDTFFQRRLATLTEVLGNGVSADASGAIRQRAYDYALAIWQQHPWFGVGFGHSFPNPNPFTADADFQLDTPMLYLAKFGLFGTIGIVAVMVLFAIGSQRVKRTLGFWSQEQTAWRVFIFSWVLILPFGTPTEDKGFALAVALMIFLAARKAKESEFAAYRTLDYRLARNPILH
jgi:O-antigen ligase